MSAIAPPPQIKGEIVVTPAKSSTKKAATARDSVPVSAKTPRTAKAKATTSSGPSLRFYHSEVLRE